MPAMAITPTCSKRSPHVAAPPAINATANEGLSILLRLLAPITPHIAHRLWRELGFGEDVMVAPWPEPDPAALEQDEIELVVQVNGKLRGSIRVPKAADREAIQHLAAENQNVKRFIEGQTIKKIGELARTELEQLFGRRVHLFLFVKVREDWAENSEHYKEIGLDFPNE